MKKKFLELATRENSFEGFSTFKYFQNPDKILKAKGDDISIYEDLLADDHVRAVTRTRKANVLNLEWKISGVDNKKNIVDFVLSELKRLDVYRLINSAMDAVLFGYKVFELNFENTKIESVKGKPCRWFCFDSDNNLLFRSKRQPTGELVPQNKFLVVTQEATADNPYGFPDLSCVYWYVVFKKGNIQFWIKFIEKYGMPWTIGKTPPATSEDDKMDLLDKIDNLREDGAAVINDDSNIDFIEAAGKQTSGDLYNNFTNFCNAAISKAILGNTLTTENTEGVGSQALGEVHQKTAEAIINGDKRIICSFFNRLIKLIINLQFGEQPEYPTFELNSPQEINTVVAERDNKLHAQGVRFTRKYYKKTYGLEDEDFELAADEAAYSEVPQIDDDEITPPPYLDQLISRIEECDSYEESKEKILSYIKEETPPELINRLGKILLIGRLHGEESAR